MKLNTLRRFGAYRNQLIYTALAHTSKLIYGFCLSWTVPVVIMLKDPSQTPLPEIIDDITASWIGSAVYIGFVTGPYVGNFLSNKYGRTPSLLLGGTFCILAFILQSFFTTSLNIIYVQRAFQGFGIMSISLGSSIYVSEIVSTEIRGMALVVESSFSALGSLILLGIAPFLTFQQIGYFGLCMSVIYVTSLYFLPESPHWLLLNDKDEDSKNVMKRLNRTENLRIDTNLEVKGSWTNIFKTKGNRKALFITSSLFALMGCSGLTTVVFYMTSIYEMANLSIKSEIASIITQAIALLVSLVSAGLVENVGRKKILAISTLITSLSLIILGFYYYLASLGYSEIDKLNWMSIMCVMFYIISFNFGFGVIPVTLTSEMFDKNDRSLGPTLSVTPGIVLAFVAISTFGYMLLYTGIHTILWLYSVANVLAFLFTLAFVPETKGKTFKEIQEILSK